MNSMNQLEAALPQTWGFKTLTNYGLTFGVYENQGITDFNADLGDRFGDLDKWLQHVPTAGLDLKDRFGSMYVEIEYLITSPDYHQYRTEDFGAYKTKLVHMRDLGIKYITLRIQAIIHSSDEPPAL